MSFDADLPRIHFLAETFPVTQTTLGMFIPVDKTGGPRFNVFAQTSMNSDNYSMFLGVCEDLSAVPPYPSMVTVRDLVGSTKTEKNKYVPALTLDRWIREYIQDPIIPPSPIVLNALSSMESNQPMGNFSTEGDTSLDIPSCLYEMWPLYNLVYLTNQ